MSNQDKQKVYFNDAQNYVVMMMTRFLVMVAGRGIGKGLVQAMRMMNVFQGMPRSTSGFVGPSYKKLLTSIIPSLVVHFERLGYKREIHYVINKKPWKSLHWDKPVFTPESWEHTISFYNGSVVQLITQDREGASNGLSLDHIFIDEAKLVDYEKLKNETFQTNRGNEQYFGGYHLHHGLTITCDMPVTKKGSWFLNYERQMDPELVKVIEGMIYQKWALQQRLQKYPDRRTYYEKQIKYLSHQLNVLRYHCTLYKEYSSIENVAILGVDFIRQMKRQLPPLTFQTSIMSRRIGISADGFYGALREDVNYYSAPNTHYLDGLDYTWDPVRDKVDCRTDGDIDPDLPLIVAFDANANINWCVVGQVHDDTRLRILKSFYTKYERKLPELIDDVCSYYRYHRTKKVVFYFDATFVGNNYALQNDDFHHAIVRFFRGHNWLVDDVYIGKPMDHIQKNLLINRMLQGRAKHQVLINKDNNEDLLISITTAGVYNGKKDKRGEKLVETEEDKLESRTDGSDAFDTLCIGVEKFPRVQMKIGGIASVFPD